MATSNNEEIFLADSQGWKEEAQAVIKDVKEQVKDINISDKLQVITSKVFFAQHFHEFLHKIIHNFCRQINVANSYLA